MALGSANATSAAAAAAAAAFPASEYDIVADASPWTRLLPRPTSAAAVAAAVQAAAAAAVAAGGVGGSDGGSAGAVLGPAPLHLLSRLEGLQELDLSHWEVLPEPGGEPGVWEEGYVLNP
jgi:hypothetical protein